MKAKPKSPAKLNFTRAELNLGVEAPPEGVASGHYFVGAVSITGVPTTAAKEFPKLTTTASGQSTQCFGARFAAKTFAEVDLYSFIIK